jgi:hypothetical protein
MWPQLSSPIERFFVLLYFCHLIIVINILYSVHTDNVYQRAGVSLHVPLSPWPRAPAQQAPDGLVTLLGASSPGGLCPCCVLLAS